MNKFKTALMVMLSAGMMASCTQDQGKTKEKENMKKVGQFDPANMHTHVHPGTDFYNHANGGWMEKSVIPDDEARWGSFNELRESNNKMTLKLIDKALASKDVDAKSDLGKMINFFNAAMDTDARNTKGVKPIQKYLDRIDAITSSSDLLDFTIDMEPYVGGLFGSGVYGDAKNSSINALYLGGGTLGLPERSYYVENDDDSKDKRAKYLAHVTRMFGFLGMDEDKASASAKDVLAFETEIATPKYTKEERRDPIRRYNPKTMVELKKLAPSIDWDKYYNGIGAKNFDKVIVSNPKYIAAIDKLISETPIETIKTYFKWVVLNDAAGSLSEEINDANFDFYGKTLRDLKEQKPLKERVLSTTNGVLGEALGKLYVAEYFPKEAKQSAVDMVNNLKRAYEKRINKLDWMTDATKKNAIEKLHGMQVKIGYPDKWKDYSDLAIGNDMYQNILNSRKWNFDQDIQKIGKEVDKTEWFMNPQTVNAYYNPMYNEIVFPAAILQPPFFDYTADAALNYGGMGAVIGHEISHGFDDQGAKFDADGNMVDWWTEEDEKNFKQRGDQLVAQFDSYEALPGVFVNGRFTLGENIGDLGGVNSAYDALLLHLEEHGGGDKKIDDMTPQQRFFVNWATIWRTKYRDEALINQIKTDPHSPGMFRATGPLVNVDAFYEAFGIKEGDDMYKPVSERIKIW